MAFIKGQPFKPQFVDPTTNLLMSDGTIEFYLSGTTTPTAFYTDSAGTSGGTSIELNTGGQPPTDIYFDSDITYKIVVKDGQGTTLQTLDPYSVPVSFSEYANLATNGISHTENSTTYNLATYLQSQYRISVKDFGAVGDGSTDDTTAIQSAIDAAEAGGVSVFFPAGDYRVSVTKGTNDKYGIKIDSSNMTLVGESGASLRRLSSDISSYALSFPILLIGKPDSNLDGDQIENIRVEGLEFVGEDTRHSVSGNALFDGRQAIWLKNCKNVTIEDNTFSSIDSSAIWAQRPGDFDYENSAYYNTTKCYNIRVIGNDFFAQSHNTAGRALIHAVSLRVDDAKIHNNHFEWCDVAVNISTTYDDYDDVETDTYTDSNLSTAVKRVGRGYCIQGNIFKNSSEHCMYLDAMSVAVGPNTVIVTDQATCNTTQFQIRGRGISITGGTMVGVARAGGINTGATDVTWTGTTIYATGDSAGGIINIQSQGLTSYIDNRADFFQSYKAMQNIRVDVTINMPEAAQTDGVGIRLYTDTTDANFPDGQMLNVNLSGTIINNAKKAILNIAPLARNVACDNMVLNGKPFTTNDYGDQGAHDGANNASVLTDSSQSWTVDAYVGWRIKNVTDGSEAAVTANTATTITGALSGGTDDDWDTSDVWQLVPPQNSLCALGVDDSSSLVSSLREVSFSNNKVRGFQHVLYDDGGAGAAGTFFPPSGVTDNTFDFIEYWDTDAFREPSFDTRFSENTGRRFLDRTGWFSSTSINNSLSDGSSNSEKKGCIQLVSSSDVRIYHDDDNGFKAL